MKNKLYESSMAIMALISIILIILLKLESTEKDQSPRQLWFFFAKISFKPLLEDRFEHYVVNKL